MAADPTPPEILPADRPKPARVYAPRLPGTYAANFESDMDWRRGVVVLWVLVGAAAVCEAVYAAFYFLKGGVGYPGNEQGVRLVAEGVLFVALWLGWGWLRWPLAAMNFFYGVWLVIWLVASHARDPAAPPDAPPPTWGIDSIPVLATAIVYAASGVYLAFSADVLDFLRHRREEGRGWVVAPLVLVVGVYLVALFNAQWIYRGWLEHEKASALAYVTKSLEVISGQHWDAAAYEARADPEFLKTWFDGDRKNVFAGLARLGAFRHGGRPNVTVGCVGDATGGGFVVNSDCNLGETAFEHGRTQFEIDLGRTLFGEWKLRGFSATDVHLDDPPDAAHR